MRRIVEECFARAEELLVEHRDRLGRIVAALLARESLDKAEA